MKPAADRRIRVHVKNNHASPDTFPPTLEGEAVFTITQERFDIAARKHVDVAYHLDVVIDWDLDRFEESMRDAEVLVTWDLPTANLAEVAPNLAWIHIIELANICPMDWLPSGVTVVNNRGTHADKGGEFAVMSVLMLHNKMPLFSPTTTQTGVTLFDTRRWKTAVVIGGPHWTWCSGAAQNTVYTLSA